jgi:hypothetical protein
MARFVPVGFLFVLCLLNRISSRYRYLFKSAPLRTAFMAIKSWNGSQVRITRRIEATAKVQTRRACDPGRRLRWRIALCLG